MVEPFFTRWLHIGFFLSSRRSPTSTEAICLLSGIDYSGWLRECPCERTRPWCYTGLWNVGELGLGFHGFGGGKFFGEWWWWLISSVRCFSGPPGDFGFTVVISNMFLIRIFSYVSVMLCCYIPFCSTICSHNHVNADCHCYLQLWIMQLISIFCAPLVFRHVNFLL